MVTDREKLGRPITVADAQIAAICRVHRATLATRNIKDFHDTGIELIAPGRPSSCCSQPKIPSVAVMTVLGSAGLYR